MSLPDTVSNSESPMVSPLPLNDALSILVYRSDLRGVHQSGLKKDDAFGSRNIFRFRKRVRVAAAPFGLRENVLYAPESPRAGGLNKTEFVRVNKENNKNIVKKGDAFEISFVGMSVKPHDGYAGNSNELLMYSLTANPEAGKGEENRASEVTDSVVSKDSDQSDAKPPTSNALIRSNTSPTGVVPSSRDLVYVHFDPVVEGHDNGNKPDTFVSIPAGKTLYRRFKEGDAAGCAPSTRARFSIMEIDKVSDVQARSVAGIDQVGSFVSTTAVAVPYLELLTRAFAVASTMGRRGLRRYAKPDHVLSSDYKFMLANSDNDNEDQPTYADYLQYGYYFFLSKPVEAQLYAQTGSSSQRVPLFLKREDALKGRERQYFPLTGVSYLVMKVSKGCYPDPHALDLKNVQTDHRARLENITSMSNAIELLSAMRSGKRGNATKGLA